MIERPAIDRLTRVAFAAKAPVSRGAAWAPGRAESRIGV
jgi:hypothetical protein